MNKNNIIIGILLFVSFCLVIIIFFFIKSREDFFIDDNLSIISKGMVSLINNDDYNYEPITNNTKNVLKDIYLKFNESILEINSILFQNGYIKTNMNTKEFIKPKGFNMIPELLQNDINTNLIYQTVYKYNIFGKEITIYINEEKYDIDEYNECIKRMMILFSTYLKYSNKKCSNKLSIFLFFSKMAKTLPKYEQLERHHLNNAYTYPCLNESELVIYRKEEWFKVFCHESIHNLGLDFSKTDDTISKNEILKIFPIKSDVRLFEAYTETWAKIMNCIFVSIYESKETNLDSFISRFNYLITKERIFTILQTVKILNHMGLQYEDLYELSDKHINKRETYNEKTYLISYFVINSILLNNYQEFIEWCLNNNVNILQFDNENYKEKQQMLCEFIRKYHDSKILIKRFNNILEYYNKKNNENVDENLSYLLTTLKKSVIERK
jgi:hypothetical protein